MSVIYAQNSVEKMLTGHAYARAIRGHILTHLGLEHIILQTIEFTEEHRYTMELILNNIDRSVILRAEEDDTYNVVFEKFKNTS